MNPCLSLGVSSFNHWPPLYVGNKNLQNFNNSNFVWNYESYEKIEYPNSQIQNYNGGWCTQSHLLHFLQMDDEMTNLCDGHTNLFLCIPDCILRQNRQKIVRIGEHIYIYIRGGRYDGMWVRLIQVELMHEASLEFKTKIRINYISITQY